MDRYGRFSTAEAMEGFARIGRIVRGEEMVTMKMALQQRKTVVRRACVLHDEMDTIEDQFEALIVTMEETGYRLDSWRHFSEYEETRAGELARTVVAAENIVAVFVLGEKP